MAVGVLLWMLVGNDVSNATDQSEAVGSHVREAGSGVESPGEERGGIEAVEGIRRQIKRALATLAAENGTDPTAIIGQLSPRTRYQNRDEDQRVQEIIRVSLPLAPDWLVRVDLPFTYLDPKSSNEKSVAGVGDLRARLGWRLLNTIDGSFFIGSEFYFPTATNDQLGSGRFAIGPAVVGSVHLPDLKSNAFLWVEYLTSVTGNLRGSTGGSFANDSSTSETRVRLRLNTLWSEKWWSFVESRFFVDWTENAKTGMVLLFEGGKRLDANWRLYVRPEVGLWGRDLPGAFDYGVEFGVRYMFYRF